MYVLAMLRDVGCCCLAVSVEEGTGDASALERLGILGVEELSAE